MIGEILNFVRIRNSVKAFSLTTGFSLSQGCDLFSPLLSSHDVVSQPARARKVRGQCAARKNDERPLVTQHSTILFSSSPWKIRRYYAQAAEHAESPAARILSLLQVP